MSTRNYIKNGNQPSWYYKYANFVSPDILFAKVKEELRSYFSTGAIDDFMLPIWTNDCLRKVGKGTNPILQTLLLVEDFQAKLPVNFISVREAWMCAGVDSSFTLPAATYEQAYCRITPEGRASINNTKTCCNSTCEQCFPDVMRVTYKVQDTVSFAFRRNYLLRPANINAVTCSSDCFNTGVGCPDEYDIKDGKLVTNFRKATVLLVYYASKTDEQGNQMLPDNFFLLDYIEHFIKAKVFELLLHIAPTESYQQSERKYTMYKQMADEKFVTCIMEARKETVEQKIAKMRKIQDRFKKYEIT